jgi:hypothetical protein
VQRACRTCHVLLVLLTDAKDRLALTISRMRTLTGAARPVKLAAALRFAQNLRMQCEALRAEAERHKMWHYRVAGVITDKTEPNGERRPRTSS